jgi:dihydroflavonol-4-reductase
MKKVFVLGGTGFLGYYTVKELLNRGYQVKTMALPPLPTDDLLPEEVELTLGDINQLSDDEILELLSDVYGFMYAAGADERVVPERPALKFFYEVNVLPTQRIARLAAKAGVKKFVIYGSYFSKTAEEMPELGLKDQAYPNTRLLQEQVAFAEGEGIMDVTSLRLPYIFGTMPGRMPLWKMFTDQIKGQEQWAVLGGSTSSVTVEQVAEAAVGAMENGSHRETFPINMYNLKHEDFHRMMIKALGQEDTTSLNVVPYEVMQPQLAAIDQQCADEGLEHGIHMALAQKLADLDIVTDPALTKDKLKINEYDVIATIEKTLEKCVSE